MDIETCEYLEKQYEAVMKGYRKAGITVAINFAKIVYANVENPFDQERAEEKIIKPLKHYMKTE